MKHILPVHSEKKTAFANLASEAPGSHFLHTLIAVFPSKYCNTNMPLAEITPFRNKIMANVVSRRLYEVSFLKIIVPLFYDSNHKPLKTKKKAGE